MVETKQNLGLAVLTSSAVFGAWSAWNSSLFTAATFVDDENKYKNAKLAMDLGLATAIATGIGVHLVYGKEGRQAANNADFAIGEFKFLRRLLLVHGRWNYIRQAKVFLYSMHKNMVMTFTLFWYR